MNDNNKKPESKQCNPLLRLPLVFVSAFLLYLFGKYLMA